MIKYLDDWGDMVSPFEIAERIASYALDSACYIWLLDNACRDIYGYNFDEINDAEYQDFAESDLIDWLIDQIEDEELDKLIVKFGYETVVA